MYRGEAYLHQDRINSVLRTASSLQIKGLSEGPRSIEINQNMHGSGSSRSLSPALSNPEGGSPRHNKIKRNDMDRDDSPLLRRPVSPSVIHGGNNGGGNGGLSPSYSYPPSTSRHPFPIYRGVSSFGGGGARADTAYSPPLPHQRHRSKSPPPSRSYPNSTFTPPPPPGGPPSVHDHPKDEGREAAPSAAAQSSSSAVDMYEVRSAPSRGGDSDRPPSNKTDRQTPSDYDPRRTPQSAPSPHGGMLKGFPSDSTTDGPSGLIQRATPVSTTLYKEEPRMRRESDQGSELDGGSGPPPPLGMAGIVDPQQAANEDRKFPVEFRNSREDLSRISNSSPDRSNGKLFLKTRLNFSRGINGIILSKRVLKKN